MATGALGKGSFYDKINISRHVGEIRITESLSVASMNNLDLTGKYRDIYVPQWFIAQSQNLRGICFPLFFRAYCPFD